MAAGGETFLVSKLETLKVKIIKKRKAWLTSLGEKSIRY